MLYRLNTTDCRYDRLDPLPFKDFAHFGKREKEMEHLIAGSILDVLFEDASLMPIFQERQYQAEADIYALNEQGDLVIFELKRGTAGDGAVHQALRYAQDAGQWSYATLQDKFKSYAGSTLELTEAHREAFNLEHPLDPKSLNKRQHLIIIGSAADDALINAVSYWQRQGIAIEFLPYRIYELSGEAYFEFFALPFDRHRNPADIKGVLFDTNRSYDEAAIWYMFENSRVAAFGDATRFIEHLSPGDIVFFSHKWSGLVAAGRVRRGQIRKPDDETSYREVDFLTPIPKRGSPLKAMPFGNVSQVTAKSFYWARTIKVPYLSKSEAESLLASLQQYLADTP